MKEYAYYGYTEFIICAGYRQEYIKEWLTFMEFEQFVDVYVTYPVAVGHEKRLVTDIIS